MKFFSNLSARRHAAFIVLLVWLFALVSGLANACLLETHETHSHVVAAASFEAMHTFKILPGHAGAIADQSGVSESHLKASCLKVCDDGSRSLPNHVLTVAHTDPGPALLVQVLWSTVALQVPALRQVDDEQPDTPGLPVRVRFSRLAI